MTDIAKAHPHVDPSYGLTAHLRGVSFDDARARITDALKGEGFGILTEIDVAKTLDAKIGKTIAPYVILGACNPTLAHQAISGETGVGLLLPCNVCLWAEDGGVAISIAKPTAMFSIVGNDGVAPVAREAEARLARALDVAAQA